MFYLKDAQGNVVRALNFSTEQMTFVFRHDNHRVETTENTAYLDKLGVKYTLLDVVNKKSIINGVAYPIKGLTGHLSLVREGDQILKNVDLPSEEEKQFEQIFKKTSQVGGAVAILFFGLSFILKTKVLPKEELQVVQVMDRKQIEKSLIMPAVEKKIATRLVQKAKHPKMMIPMMRKKQSVAKTSGVLGVLGSLKNSHQRGGLKLNEAQASAGIGRGGNQGSGGIQTSVYAKGMFSAPLGAGGKVNGAGGYGTRGKGGGRAGYGEVSLVGSGSSFFQPVESEAWIGGGLDRNEIAAVINRHLSEVRFCYEQGLQQKPKLAGRLSMNFMIGPNGTVSLAKVMNSSLNHIMVETCIRDRLKTWNFPKPEGGVTVKVSYPFILRRVSDT